MKLRKIISIILITIMLISCCVCAYADDFSVRNGIKFGMTKDEVIETEKQNGFTEYHDYDEKYDPTLYAGYDILKLKVSSIGGVKIGFGGYITYCFDSSGMLDTILYEYGSILKDTHDESYATIRNSLFSKYGDPLVENENKIVFTTPIYQRYNNVHKGYGGKVYRNCQWVQKYDDVYVIIDLIEFTRSAKADPADIMIEYTRMSHEEMETILSDAEAQKENNEMERDRDF